MTILLMAWSIPDQNPGSSNYWYEKVWHNKVSFLRKSCGFKRRNLPGKRRNLPGKRRDLPQLWNHSFSISPFEVFRVSYGWQNMGARNAQNQIERSGSDFFDTGTMPPTSPAFGFMGFLVLSSFALFHNILATCWSHNCMSCRLFSRWFAGTNSIQQL